MKLFLFKITLVRYMKSDVYVADLGFLVWFGGECDSCIQTLGCFSVMVASYERDEY